jgi:peptidyl-prolyl cis-trans isomerase A (cyclophilin A)
VSASSSLRRSRVAAPFLSLLALPLAFTACQDKAPAKPDSAAVAPAPAAAAAAPAQAPDSFQVAFETTKGTFVIEAKRRLSPYGVDRFYQLVQSGYFTDVRFYRVVKGFMVQFGSFDPAWLDKKILDDPVVEGNKRGTISFAKPGAPNARSSQFFINFGDNSGSLDPQGFSTFGHVVSGMDVVDKINGEYGEGAPQGRGPAQGRVQMEGNAYLKKDFPNLDYIKSAKIQP